MMRIWEVILRTLQREIHDNAKSKGWWDGEDHNFPEKIMLVVCELSEAIEEYRDGHEVVDVYINDGKPEGIPVEMADAVIRLMDICGRYGIDLESVMRKKMEYNQTRPYRHGGKKA